MDISKLILPLLLFLHPQKGVATENHCEEPENHSGCLYGGTTRAEGNVYVDGLPVCDDNWSKENGDVVCKYLGYSKGVLRVTTQSEFGQVGHKFSMDDVQCEGTEDKISNCPHKQRDDCGVMEAAGVVCDDITPQDIVKDKEMTKDCFVEGVSYNSEDEMSGKNIVSSAMHCQRLCAQAEDCARFTFHSTTKTCFQYSLSSQYRKITADFVVSGPKQCPDKNETMEKYNSGCNATICLYRNNNCTDGENWEHTGNVFVNGKPVCDDNWSFNEGVVVCKQLGFHGVRKTTKMSHFGPVPSLFSMDDVECSGAEENILNCSYSSIDNCDSGEGAGVICDTREEQVVNLEKDCFIYNLRYGQENQLDFEINVDYADDCQIKCSQQDSCSHFTWLSNNGKCLLFNKTGEDAGKVEHIRAVSGPAVCSPDTQPNFDPSGNCTETNVICLVGGSTNKGNVFVGGKPVCDDGWNLANGHVVCREMGFVRALKVTRKSHFGEVPRVFGLDNVDCTGQENQLRECTNSPTEDCEGSEGAGVVCDPVSFEENTRVEVVLSEKCFAKNVVYGSPLSNELIYLPSVSDCQIYCQKDPQCDTFSFNNQTRECSKRSARGEDPTENNGPCPSGWTSLTTGCYKLTDSGNQQQAETNCKNEGGFLAEIENQEEHNQITSFTQEQVWVGATDIAKDGEWVWSRSGKKMTFNNWRSGEPNGGTRENCLEANSHNGAWWNDKSCSTGNYKGLCEKGDQGQIWSEEQQQIWNDNECPNLSDGLGSFVGVSLDECKRKCLDTPTCTAINYRVMRDCVLRACPFPVPLPQWIHQNYKGYFIRTNQNEMELTGYCLTSSGQDQNDGTHKLNSGGKADCFGQCKAVSEATGCEWHKDGACIYHTQDVADGNGNSDYRCWLLNFAPKDISKVTEDEYFYIESELNGLVLDVKDGGTHQGNTLHMWPKSGSPSQLWKWDGMYLQSKLNGLVLYVADGNTRRGTSVQMWPKMGTPGQKWKYEGKLIMSELLDNFVLEIKWGSKNQGTPVWMYTANWSKAQMWNLKTVPGKKLHKGACSFESVGCWKDRSRRAIPSLEGTDESLVGTYQKRANAVLDCYKVAKSRGYPAFAVQNGGWCAGSDTAMETYKQYGVSSKCKDGKGGPWANNVYQISCEEKRFQSLSTQMISGPSSCLSPAPVFDSEHCKEPGSVCLVGGSTFEGNIFVGGKPVCDDQWNLSSAQIICRQLGLGRAKKITQDSQFGNVKGPFSIGNVECTGSEEHITDCTFNNSPQCLGDEAAGVVCETDAEKEVREKREQMMNECFVKDICYGDEASHWQVLALGRRFPYRRHISFHDDHHLEMGHGLFLTKRRKRSLPRNPEFGSLFSRRHFKYANSLEECQKYCQNSDSCTHFTFDKKSQMCFETNTSNKSDCMNAISGPKSCDKVSTAIRIPKMDPCSKDGRLCLWSRSGRMESAGNVFIGGKPVCDDSWSLVDAEVVCKQLNFHTVRSITTNSHFGYVSGTFSMDDVECTGSENNLTKCSHQKKDNCDGNEAAGVICDIRNATIIENEKKMIRDCFMEDITFEGDIVNSFVNVRFAVDCQNYCSKEINCTHFTLHTQSHNCTLYEGQELGISKKTSFGSYSGPRSCEDRANIVEIDDGDSNCTRANDLCLKGGRGDFEGNVFWGGKPVCDDKWDLINANVVCKMLGYSRALEATTKSHFGNVSMIFSLDDVLCRGDEDTLEDCLHTTEENCDGSEAAGVTCDNRNETDIEEQDQIATCFANNVVIGQILELERGPRQVPFLYLSTAVDCHKWCQMNKFCEYFNFEEASKKCFLRQNIFPNKYTKEGLVSGPRTCVTVDPDLMNINGEHCFLPGVACVGGGSGPHEGNVHIGGKPICDDTGSWGLTSAHVFCKQMGYRIAKDFQTKSYFGPVKGPFFGTNVHCIGSENTVVNCLHSPASNCLNMDAVGVVCETFNEWILEVDPSEASGSCFERNTRYGGSDNANGKINGHGDVKLTVGDCQAACQGNPECNYFTYFYESRYLSSGNKTTWLCRLLRFKGESQNGRLNYISGPKQCPVCKIYNHEGRCLKYLGKECMTPRAVCLVGGVNATEGNVYVGGKPVCDDEWNKNDADVVCRQLGFLKGALRSTRKSFFGSVSTSYGMDNVMCTGSENELNDCQHSKAEHDCGREEGAGVVCLPNDEDNKDQNCANGSNSCCHAVHIVHSSQTVLTNDEYFKPENILKDDCDEINLQSPSKTTFWLAPRGMTGELLTLDLGCSKLLEKITLKNTHNYKYNNRGLGNFTISLSNSTEGPWIVIITDQLPDARYLGCSVPVYNFSVNHLDKILRTGRFVTLNVLTFYGDGAGLQYLSIQGHFPELSRTRNIALPILLAITALLIMFIFFIYLRKQKFRDIKLMFLKYPAVDVVEFDNLVTQHSVNSEEFKA